MCPGGNGSTRLLRDLTVEPESDVKGAGASALIASLQSPANPVPPSSEAAGTVGGSGISSSGMEGAIPSYPPTEVEHFLVCPTYWHLTKRWLPRTGIWEPAMTVGSAVHEGLFTHWRRAQSAGNPLAGELRWPMDMARKYLEDNYVEQPTWLLESLWKLVEKGVTLGINAKLEGGRQIVTVDQTIHGRKPDIVFRNERSQLIVTDVKVSMSLDTRNLVYREAEYDHSWQFLDYGWHVRDWFQEPVRYLEAFTIALGPGRGFTKVYPVQVDDTRLDQWYRSATSVWMQMKLIEDAQQDLGVNVAWMNLRACTNKGLHFGKPKCPMHEGCHRLKGNEALFEGIFERRIA